MAKHAAFGVFLRKLSVLAIQQGVVPSPNPVKRKKVKTLGSKKHRRVVREGRLPPPLDLFSVPYFVCVCSCFISC
jgi:hypothetical protein